MNDQTQAAVPRTLSTVDKVKQRINSDPAVRDQIMRALPKHIDADFFLRVVLTTINKSPKIAECDFTTIITCMLDCSAMGLQLDGQLAHLIPFGRTCQLIVDYKGLIELIMRTGKVDFVDAVAVHKNDTFKVVRGANPDLVHFPNVFDPGEFIGAYAIAFLKDVKFPKFEVMNKAQIDAIRKRSRASGAGPWVSDYEAMAKKTAVRQLSKLLPKSRELLESSDRDYERGEVDTSNLSELGKVVPVSERAKIGAPESAPESMPEEPPQATAPTPTAPAPVAPAAVSAQPTPAAAPAAQTELMPADTAVPRRRAASTVQATEDDVVLLAKRCLEENVSEAAICNFVRVKYRQALPGDATLADLNELHPRRVTLLLNEFDDLLPAIRELQ